MVLKLAMFLSVCCAQVLFADSAYHYLDTINLTKFLGKASSPSSWMEEHIQHELEPWKETGISQRALNATYRQADSHGPPISTYIWRYRIVGNRIYRYNKHNPYTPEIDGVLRTFFELNQYLKDSKFPTTLDFMINLLDGMPVPWEAQDFWITRDRNDQAPVLVAWKRKDASFTIAVPQRGALVSFHHTANEVAAGNARYPWDKKVKNICWRGNLSDIWMPLYDQGDEALIKHYPESPRFKICYLATQYPAIINAGFTLGGFQSDSRPFARFLCNYARNYLPIQEQLQYSYLPLIDGYGNFGSGGAGYEWRLLSNSLVFKQDSSCVTWFESPLKPYTHFIPVNNNLDDLVEKYYWAYNNDEQCQKIVCEANKFAQNNLMVEDMYTYLLVLFREYAKYQTFSREEMLQEISRDPNWLLIWSQDGGR